jgi:hypothetical protein
MKKSICLVLVAIICVATFLTVNCSAAIVEDNKGKGYCLFGDVNRDETINICDLVSLNEYKIGNKIDICLNAGDFDGDGTVTKEDLKEFCLSILGINNNFETGGNYWTELY